MNTTNMRTLLFIDNEASHVDVFTDPLLNATDGPFMGECVKTLAEAIRRLRKKEFWAIFVNLSVLDSLGLETFDKLALAVPGVPTLIIAGAKDVGVALEALRHGAKDYPLEHSRQGLICSRDTEHGGAEDRGREVVHGKRTCPDNARFHRGRGAEHEPSRQSHLP